MTTVHVHACPLDRHRHRLDAAGRLLAADELARAARFRSAAARDEFLLARLLLRDILAGHLGHPPGAFAYGAFGKPMLSDGGLEFNLSHSRGWMLVAVSASHPVGVDIERCDAVLDPLALARTGLPAADLEVLLGTPPEARSVRFCALWTRWEACLKALGSGLGRPPGLVARHPLGDGAELVELADGAGQVAVCDLPAAAGYRAAVALAGGRTRPRVVLREVP